MSKTKAAPALESSVILNVAVGDGWIKCTRRKRPALTAKMRRYLVEALRHTADQLEQGKA